MKLMTKIENGTLWVIDPECSGIRTNVDANAGHIPVEQACLRHDAMAAHRLLIAVNELAEALGQARGGLHSGICKCQTCEALELASQILD